MKNCFFKTLILSLAFWGVFSVRQGVCAEPAKLNLYVAAGLKKAMDVVVDEFTKENSVEVYPNYGPSGGLYTQIIKGQPCDIYFSADWGLLEKLEEQQFLAQRKKFLKDFIVLVVSKTGKDKIRSFNDLTQDRIVLSIADPRAPVGRYAEKGLQSLGLFDMIVAKDNIKAKPSTVNQLAILVQKDQVDAGLIFQSVANMYALPYVDSMGTDLTGEIIFGIGVIKGGNEALANQFMDFAVKNVSEFVSYGWVAYE